ncbi:alpha/beta fold hydrolase [Cupriavidus sp. USMAA2-4]|uniref:alpha/beta fold hydrolase n=1 Tax=Cupriavidus sp. USMAA2-4 TaxID=876364 RepID=UPI000AB67D90|nr:alpha/beta hydrolase [Cupriavidus sp. USMAA2-4]
MDTSAQPRRTGPAAAETLPQPVMSPFAEFPAQGVLPGWREAGAGRPLLCLHGWSIPGTAFSGQAALARRGWRVIAPDHAGHGLSRSLPGAARADIGRLAADAAALIAHLGLDDVVVVGWSLGATTAWRLMQDHPEVPLAAVAAIDMTPRLLSAPDWPHGLRGGYSADQVEQMAVRVRQDWPGLAPAVAADLWAAGSAPSPAAAELVAHGQQHCDPLALSSLWRDMAAQDLRQALRHARLPLLLLHGERSRLYGPAMAAAVGTLNPATLQCSIAATGHSPHLERPAAFNAALLALLDRAGVRFSRATSAPQESRR